MTKPNFDDPIVIRKGGKVLVANRDTREHRSVSKEDVRIFENRELVEIIREHTGAHHPAVENYYAMALVNALQPKTAHRLWNPDEQKGQIVDFSRRLRDLLYLTEKFPHSILTKLISIEQVDALRDIYHSVEEKRAEAEEFALKGKPPGRENWQAIEIARVCEFIWRDFKGEKPPGTANADAPGPFGQFLEEVAEAMGVKTSARSALRALHDQKGKN